MVWVTRSKKKHKKGLLDSAKKMATEYSYVLSLKKKKRRRKWKESKEKEN